MATGTKTALFSRKTPGGVFNLEDQNISTGDRYWVDSGSGSDTANGGTSPDDAFATLDTAIGNCTANQGDIIYLMEGHAETKSATGSLFAADVAGITVIGLGKGADRPTFTFSHTGASTTISAASIAFKNCLFVAGVDSVTAPITISGADCTLEDCEFRDTTDVEAVRWILTTAAADRLKLVNCRHNGYTGGDASVNFARLVGVDGCLIQDCQFHGNYSTAVIEFHTTACTGVDVLNCVFNDTGTTDLSDNIVDTATGSTWFVDSHDLSAGAHFSGGSGGDVATDDVGALASIVGTANATTTDSVNGKIGTDTEMADNSLYDLLGGAGLKTDSLHDILAGTGGITTWPAAAQAADAVSLAEAIRYMTANQLPQFATATSAANLTDADLWTFTGTIEIIHLVGRVTTVHPASANTCKLTITPDAFSAYDICTATDLTGMDAGTLISITGTAAGALVVTDAQGAMAPGQANSVIATCVTSGVISTVFSDTGNQSGAIAWYMVWRPIAAGSTVT